MKNVSEPKGKYSSSFLPICDHSLPSFTRWSPRQEDETHTGRHNPYKYLLGEKGRPPTFPAGGAKPPSGQCPVKHKYLPPTKRRRNWYF
jgi:hypothetical protein